MDALLDTAIIIDIYRNHEIAVKWLEANKELKFGISSITWMECVYGAQDKQRQKKILELLALFSIVYITDSDQQWAMQQVERYGLSHNIGVPDCLIAAPSYRLQLPLYTANLKHFTPLLGDLAQKPY